VYETLRCGKEKTKIDITVRQEVREMSAFGGGGVGGEAEDGLIESVVEDPTYKPAFGELDDLANRVEADKVLAFEANERRKSLKLEHERAPSDEALTASYNASKAIAKERLAQSEASQSTLTAKISQLSATSGLAPAVVLKGLDATHQKAETRKVMDMLKDAQTVDMCFVFDTTGSMRPAFDCLRTHIRQILTDIKKLNPFMQYRIGLVAYKDP